MSSANRLKLFRESVVAKNLAQAKLPAYQAYYRRLFFTRRATEFILCSLIIFGGHELLMIDTFFSPVWPTAGVALSAVFLRGNVMLFGIFAGILSSYIYNYNLVLLSIAQAALFTFFIYLLRLFCLIFIGPVTPIAEVKTFWKFSLVCAVLCACHVSAVSVLFVQTFQTSVSLYGLGVAWLGELNGILCLTPLCLVFDPFTPQNYFGKKGLPWKLATVGIFLCHLFFFYAQSNEQIVILAGIFLCLLCIYGAIFGQIPLCITLFSVSIIYLMGTLPNSHLFLASSAKVPTFLVILLFTLSILLSLSIATRKQQKYYEMTRLT